MNSAAAGPGASLFRREVIERRSAPARPVFHLSQPKGSWALTGIVGVLLLVLVGLAAYTPTPRSVILPGTLVSSSRPIEIGAPRPGNVTRLYVQDGQIVHPGDPLVAIGVDVPTEADVSPAGAAVASLERLRAATRQQVPLASEGSSEELRGMVGLRAALQEQILSLGRQLATTQRMTELSRRSISSIAPLVERGFVSRAESDRREETILAQEVQEQNLSQQIASMNGQLRELDGRIGHSRLAARERTVELEGNAAELDGRIAQARANQSYILRAPSGGKVTSMRTGVGQAMSAGQIMFVVVPERPNFSVEVYAASAAAVSIRQGQLALIEYDGFPANTYGTERGVVRSVSQAPIRVNPNDAPVYLVRLDISHRDNPRLIEEISRSNGMTGRVKILVRQQSLLATLFRSVTG